MIDSVLYGNFLETVLSSHMDDSNGTNKKCTIQRFKVFVSFFFFFFLHDVLKNKLGKIKCKSIYFTG